MSKIKVYQLAQELGVSSKELLEHAQHLGYEVRFHTKALEPYQADELRQILQGTPGAAQHIRQHVQESPQSMTPPPQAEAGQESLMLVNMGKHDVRVSQNYEVGFDAMVKVIAALLADLKQTIRTGEQTIPWGQLYFLRADRSTPLFGYIELEYGGEHNEGSQRQKGVLGDLLWSAQWLNEEWTRPFEKLAQVVGITRDPEADYRNQLESDLRALEARGRIQGLNEWEIYTAIPGRNVYLSPKEEFSSNLDDQ